MNYTIEFIFFLPFSILKFSPEPSAPYWPFVARHYRGVDFSLDHL